MSGRGVMILDGGLGTTLDEVFHQDISNKPLWSMKTVVDDPETIIQAHLAFLRAGARVISTSTYQCAFSSFLQAGYSRKEGQEMMRKSVQLANDAKWRFIGEQHMQVYPSEIKIALSLGPFGATLSPAQEYDGVYPPPYGPKGYTTQGPNINRFRDDDDDDDDVEKVERSIQALAHFHLERLIVFSDHADIWGMIDHVAFETVPLAREVKAIRRAMSRLKEELVMDADMKPWWISCTFPSGQFPEWPLSPQQVAAAAFDHDQTTASSTRVQDAMIPTAFGINCTPLTFSRSLVHEMGLEIAKLLVKDRSLPAPMLVIYPSTDAVYDPSSRSWHSEGGEMTGEMWASDLGSVVKDVVREGVWDGVLVGGCCKVGPDKIQALSRILGRKVD